MTAVSQCTHDTEERAHMINAGLAPLPTPKHVLLFRTGYDADFFHFPIYSLPIALHLPLPPAACLSTYYLECLAMTTLFTSPLTFSSLTASNNFAISKSYRVDRQLPIYTSSHADFTSLCATDESACFCYIHTMWSGSPDPATPAAYCLRDLLFTTFHDVDRRSPYS